MSAPGALLQIFKVFETLAENLVRHPQASDNYRSLKVPTLGGLSEVVTHGQEGLCAETRDAAALPAAVSGLTDELRPRGGYVAGCLPPRRRFHL